MIEAGAAGVHFEDQLSSARSAAHGRQGAGAHTGGDLEAGGGAACGDVCNVPTLLVARHRCEGANLLTADVDERDAPFLDAERGVPLKASSMCTPAWSRRSRADSPMPLRDLVCCAETAKPDLEEARRFAEAIRHRYPDKLLAYNCSPSFNWKRKLDDATIASFQRELGAMANKFQLHHLGRLSRARLLDVRAGARLSPESHERLRDPAAGEFAAESTTMSGHSKHQPKWVRLLRMSGLADHQSAGRVFTQCLKGAPRSSRFGTR